MKKIKTLLAVTLLCGSTLAFAENDSYGKYNDNRHHHDRFDYARVLEVTPIYREVRVSEPVKECWTEAHSKPRQHHHQSAGGMLAGGIVGGIIGHHLGQGRKHRDIATAVGTLVGARIGHQAVNGRGHNRHQPETTELHETCSHYERVSYQRQIDAYQVIYNYQGQKHEIEMPYDPGKRIKMRIQVTPVI